jgi:hypothetical protein
LKTGGDQLFKLKNKHMKTTSIAFLALLAFNLAKAQTVTTLAGNGSSGFANGTGSLATFYGPSGICTDASGNIYVMDQGNGAVRKITPGGVVSTFANILGMGCGICADLSGNIFVAAPYGKVIFKITSLGVVSTFAGSGQAGCTNGTGTLASFSFPCSICTDALGNIYVGDPGCYKVRKITPGGVVTTYAGSGQPGGANGTATLASFNGPNAVYADVSGNIIVEDGNVIRKIGSNGMVSTIAGNGSAGFANGTGTLATFNYPYGICGDNSGNIYLAEYNNHVVRKITPAGVVSTFAGNGSLGFANGTATFASFKYPTGICMDTQGKYYVSEAGNEAVRKITTSVSVTISQTGNILCHGLSTGALTSTVTGDMPPYTYTWSGNAGNSPTASNLSAGIYTLIVTSNNNDTAIQTFTISQPSLLTTSVSAKNNPSCFGDMNGSITVLGNGGTPPYSYTWAGTNYTTAAINNLGAGNYTYSTIDANNCSYSSTVQLTEPDPINLTAFSSNSVVCQGESATLTGNGADTYIWTNGIVNGIAFFPTSTAVYTLSGTNTLTGCSSTLMYTLSVSDCTGMLVDNVNISRHLTIYPNPNDGYFKIKAQTNMTLILLNELGQIIKELSSDSQYNYECTFSRLENGVYLLTAKDNPYVKEKIIVSK